MADASKLQRSAVSMQAALALMPTVASTQAYGSSSDAGLQQCTGKCYQGLCSVDFDILHCCLAKQHYLQKRRGAGKEASAVVRPYPLCLQWVGWGVILRLTLSDDLKGMM